jgi:hypothetical protein
VLVFEQWLDAQQQGPAGSRVDTPLGR